MAEIVYTLTGEGSSDRRLMRPIDWLIARTTEEPFRGQWADPRALRAPGRALDAKIPAVLEEFPCDVLFVHRDADGPDYEPRVQEIATAIEAVGGHTHVKVIPVTMQEAWFLFDEGAIRRAAGRPSGKEDLELPGLAETEGVADPKAALQKAIRSAAAKTGRRRRRMSVAAAANRVADLILDYGPLLQLPAFARLRDEVEAALSEIRGNREQATS